MVDPHVLPPADPVTVPQQPRTWSSSPHSGGGWAPGGGGGAYGFMVANICPMNPAGVQAISPIRATGPA